MVPFCKLVNHLTITKFNIVIYIEKSSDGYSKLGARGKDFQKLVFSKKKREGFDLVFSFFFPKSSWSLKKNFANCFTLTR